QNWVAGGTDSNAGAVEVTVVSGFIRDSNGNVSVSTTPYSLDGFTAGEMTVLFGGDNTGAIDYASGILGTEGTFTNATAQSVDTLDITLYVDPD
ncbi:MAG: flagellin, partial [Allorhizobium sp.]